MPRPRKLRFVQVGLLAVVVSFVEMLAALAVALVLGFVLNEGELPPVPLIGDVGRFLPTQDADVVVLWTCGAFAVFFLLRGALFLFQQYAMARVVENTAVVLAHRLVDGYLSLPYEWHIQRNSAELVRNSWENVNEVANTVLLRMADLVAQVVLVIALVSVLLVTSVSLTGAAVGALGLAVALTLAVIQPRLKRYGSLHQVAAKEGLQSLQQAFGGVRDVKVAGTERAFSTAFRQARARMGRMRYMRQALVYVPRVSVEVAFLGLLLTGVVVGVLRGNVEALLSTLGVFAYAGLRLQPSLQKMSSAANHIRFSQAAVTALSEDLDALDAALADREAQDAVTTRMPFERELRLEGVRYRYPSSETDALVGVDLAVPRGSSLGIVGTTGGGKSTLLDVLCGLLTPTEGRMLVDGVDLEGNERSWRRALGVVHQSSFLIDDTIRRNIALGVPEEEIDEERVAEAVRMARLDGVVAELPEGLDTVVGEAGTRFSGGQQQRITVARALYRRPGVLVLDEGTASLDNETERQMIEQLGAIEGLTLVMVAHRLSTVQGCDQIVLLDAGRVAASGTYDELLARDARFRTLAGVADND